MLVLAPAACITSGIALSEAFDVFTRSVKFQLSGLVSNPPVVSPLIMPCLNSYNYFVVWFSAFKTNILGFVVETLRQGIPLPEMLHLKMM